MDRRRSSSIDPVGNVTTVWTGLTMVTGLAVSPAGELYALEMSTGNDSNDPPYVHPNPAASSNRPGPELIVRSRDRARYPDLHGGRSGRRALYFDAQHLGPMATIGGIVRVDFSRPQPMTISPEHRGNLDLRCPDS